jgi:hypothetical protein
MVSVFQKFSTAASIFSRLIGREATNLWTSSTHSVEIAHGRWLKIGEFNIRIMCNTPEYHLGFETEAFASAFLDVGFCDFSVSTCEGSLGDKLIISKSTDAMLFRIECGQLDIFPVNSAAIRKIEHRLHQLGHSAGARAASASKSI